MMARIQSKKILPGVLLFWIAFCGIGLQINPRLDLSTVLEIFSYLGLLIFVATRREISEMLVKIGYVRVGGILGIIGMILLGQLADQERKTYPFTPWTMFCGANPPQYYFEYIAETASGETVPFPFKDLTAFREPRQLVGAFDKTSSILAFTAKSQDRFHENEETLRRSVSLIGTAYNKLRPDNRITAISVYKVSVAIKDFKRLDSLQRQLLVRADVPSPLPN